MSEIGRLLPQPASSADADLILEAVRRVAAVGLDVERLCAVLVEQAASLVGADGGAVELPGETNRPGPPRPVGPALTVPLMVGSEPIGRLRLWSTGPGRLDRRRAWVVRALCEQAAPLIQAARLVRRAGEVLSSHDATLGATTHDIKSPLAAIRVRVEVLQEEARAGTLDAEQLGSSLARIAFGAARIERLAGTIVDLTRARRGEPLPLEREPVELVALVRRLVDEQQIATVRHRLRVEAAVERLVGEWDVERLERLVSGLLTNALRYSPRGGDVVLEIDERPDPDGGVAVLRVTDHGMGMSADEIPQMFDLFFGGRSAEHMPGSGVGLADAHQIVTAHGGTVAVESVEGAGSTFTVTLPLRAPRPSPRAGGAGG
jgi:signal transduction histidine kinase